MRIGSQDKGKPGFGGMSRNADVGWTRHYLPPAARVSSRVVETTTHDSGCAYEEWDGSSELERFGTRGGARAGPVERARVRRILAPVDGQLGRGGHVEQGPGKAHVRPHRRRHGFRCHS